MALVGAAVWIAFHQLFDGGRAADDLVALDSAAGAGRVLSLIRSFWFKGVADGEQDPLAVASGFSRNSNAPSLVASTAVWIVSLCPEIEDDATGRIGLGPSIR